MPEDVLEITIEYLMDKDGVLYEKDSKEAVGLYNCKEKKCIKMYDYFIGDDGVVYTKEST